LCAQQFTAHGIRRFTLSPLHGRFNTLTDKAISHCVMKTILTRQSGSGNLFVQVFFAPACESFCGIPD
jgi:hypothetical protein